MRLVMEVLGPVVVGGLKKNMEENPVSALPHRARNVTQTLVQVNYCVL